VTTVHAEFLVFDYPMAVDVEELRRQLLSCVAGTADPDLVNDVAELLLEGPEIGPFVDPQCVERMLTTLSDDTLRLLLGDPRATTPDAAIDVIADDVVQLYWVFECRHQSAEHLLSSAGRRLLWARR
jgi:hypothetical protein